MKNILPLVFACSVLCVYAPAANAQWSKILKGKAKLPHAPAVKRPNFVSRHLPADLQFTSQEGLRLNPLGKKHSIAPSQALSFSASEKVYTANLKHQALKLNLRIDKYERNKWIQLRERLINASFTEPSGRNKLAVYLCHPVPAETFQYIQQKYNSIVRRAQVARELVQPWVIYGSLPGEGKRPQPEDVGRISQAVHPLITDIRELRGALPDDPFLVKQQQLWEETFVLFNPLLANVVHSDLTLSRSDGRRLVKNEFNLLNADGTDYLLPQSDTLLKDEDELDEDNSWASVRANLLNPPISEQETAAERETLLKQIPAGMRIAFINDDRLPRLNFTYWAKQGYLGEGASVDEFSNGKDFMQHLRRGENYDLVITDLLVPFGGISMMQELRELTRNTPVIASSKFDRGEKDEEELFNAGFDGYLWYNSGLNNGNYGYIEYLRAMKNYFYYKNKHHWQR